MALEGKPNFSKQRSCSPLLAKLQETKESCLSRPQLFAISGRSKTACLACMLMRLYSRKARWWWWWRDFAASKQWAQKTPLSLVQSPPRTPCWVTPQVKMCHTPHRHLLYPHKFQRRERLCPHNFPGLQEKRASLEKGHISQAKLEDSQIAYWMGKQQKALDRSSCWSCYCSERTASSFKAGNGLAVLGPSYWVDQVPIAGVGNTRNSFIVVSPPRLVALRQTGALQGFSRSCFSHCIPPEDL